MGWDQNAEKLAIARHRIADNMAYLQKLRAGQEFTRAFIERAKIAARESRRLLEQIDGAPFSPLLSKIHIPD